MGLWAIAGLFLAASCAAPAENSPPGNGADPGADVGEIGGMCGGIAGFQCADENAYCKYETGVCREIADGAGVCAIRPEVCTMQYDPVCGCDDNTYSNACVAASNGVSVAYQGECQESG